MSSGMVDGCEFAPSAILNNSLYEVAGYFADSNHIAPLHLVAISEERWSTFPEAAKALIIECGLETQKYEIDLIRNEQQKDIDTLAGKGTAIFSFPQEVRDEMMAKVKPMQDKFRNTMNLGGLLDEIAAAAASVRG
jgi:TRAP-type C4-dicarboxylate transport system substrate-binding protein